MNPLRKTVEDVQRRLNQSYQRSIIKHVNLCGVCHAQKHAPPGTLFVNDTVAKFQATRWTQFLLYPADRQDHRARNGRRHLDLLSSLESLSNFGAGPGTVWHPLTFLKQSDRFLKDCDHNFQKRVQHVPEGLQNVWRIHTNESKQARLRTVKNEEV